MIIENVGTYRWLKDVGLRGPNCIETHTAGGVFEITKIDRGGRKVHGPALPDWQPWDLPVERLDAETNAADETVPLE